MLETFILESTYSNYSINSSLRACKLEYFPDFFQTQSNEYDSFVDR